MAQITSSMRIRQAWERQPRESHQAFEAFELYRDMGPMRGIRKVAKETGKSFTLMERWSRVWEWKRRADKYEEYYDALKASALHRRKMEMIERQADLGRRMQQTADMGLDCMEVEELSAQDIARLAGEGVKIERLALGDSTENVDTRGAVQVHFSGGPPPWAPEALKQQPLLGGDDVGDNPAA